MTDDELVNDYAAKVSKGEITFDKIRPQLEQRGIDEARIKHKVRRVDDEVQAALLAKGTASSLDRVIHFGIVLVMMGSIVTLGSLAGLYSSGASYMVVIAYGPIVAGVVMIVAGIRRKKNKNMGSGSETLNRTFRVRDKRGR